MKTATITVIALILAGILVAMLLPAIRARDESVPAITVEMNTILFAMRYYVEHVGPLPTNGSEEIFNALRGANPKNLMILENTDDQPDRMLDPWGHLYQLRINADGTFQVISSGPNGILGDRDDQETKSEQAHPPYGSPVACRLQEPIVTPEFAKGDA